MLPFLREDLPLKTEVLEAFNNLGLPVDAIPCVGDLDLKNVSAR